jgi:hypothetical protein
LNVDDIVYKPAWVDNLRPDGQLLGPRIGARPSAVPQRPAASREIANTGHRQAEVPGRLSVRKILESSEKTFRRKTSGGVQRYKPHKNTCED